MQKKQRSTFLSKWQHRWTTTFLQCMCRPLSFLAHTCSTYTAFSSCTITSFSHNHLYNYRPTTSNITYPHSQHRLRVKTTKKTKKLSSEIQTLKWRWENKNRRTIMTPTTSVIPLIQTTSTPTPIPLTISETFTCHILLPNLSKCSLSTTSSRNYYKLLEVFVC